MPAARSDTPRSAGDSYESHFEHTALFEFSTVINSSTDLQFILSHILLTIMGKLLSPKGMVLLTDGTGGFTPIMVKGFAEDARNLRLTVKRLPQSLVVPAELDEERHPWAAALARLGAGIVLPMSAGGQPVGMLCFAPRLSTKNLETRETTYLRSLANISATAIEKSRQMEEIVLVNRKLDRKIQELNTLFELGKEFSATLEPEKVTRLLVFSLLGQIGVSRYVIALSRGPDMIVAASRLDGPAPQGEFLKALTRIDRPSLVPDLSTRKGPDLIAPLRSMGMQVIVPMMLQGECRGLVLLGDKLSRAPYDPADLDLVSSLGNLAIISLENARLFKEAIEKQKMEDELQIARGIQKGLLPSVLPTLPSMEIAATNISSKQVGGDYYDVISTHDGRYVIAIGDVSGKGTPASLLMATLQATIRALVPLRLPLSELTARVNDLMCQNTGSDRFVTFFWAEIDPAAQTMTYVNAGHNYPYLLRGNGTHLRLEQGGMILGVLPTSSPYDQEGLPLTSGDLLVLFTDGVSEAMSSEGIEYGEERLEAVLAAHRDRPAQEIIDAVHRDILDFTRGAAQSDDITMMILKVF
jgi:sigma-B regulation protein RsbU (phosphoserine phosphatase)